MRLSVNLAASVAAAGAVALLGALPASGAQASTAAIARSGAAAGISRSVPTPRGKPTVLATFAGARLNTKIWDTCYPLLPNYGGGCTNWGNHEEAEWYTRSQVRVSGGNLRLIATRRTTHGFDQSGKPKTYGCASGMVTMYPRLRFQYGFVQVVANIPHATGLWPALWLAAANGKDVPETDMVESWGVSQLTGSFFHAATSRARATYSPSLTRGWHTYSLSWTRSKLTFYVDSRVVLTVTKNVPRQPMYFIANVAEYQPAKAGTCNGQMLIKSVKIWKG